MLTARRVWPFLGVAVLACSTDSGSPPPLARIASPALSLDGAGPAVSGHGNVIQLPSGALRTFSFQARVMPDGSVQGEYDNHNRQGGFVNHGNIDCIRFIGSNGAVLSGRVTRSTNPNAPEGSIALFRVEDNGQGSEDAPDRISALNTFAGTSANNCTNLTPATLFPIVGGNVQVTP